MNIVNQIFSTILLTFSFVATASSGIIFSDDFNSENAGVGQLNYNSFANWSVSDGTVDLIGNGYFDFLPGNGLYLDLDGSTSNSGVLSHSRILAAGDYTLSFSLAGNHRNSAPESTTASVSVGSSTVLASQSYNLAINEAFTRYSLDFSVSDLLAPAATVLSFGSLSNDNIGMLLDDVVLEQRVSSVSEPSSLALLGLGLLSLAFARRQTI